MKSFSSIVSPMAQAEFMARARAGEVIYIPAADARRFDQVLPWPMVDRLFDGGALPIDQFRLVRNGQDISPTLYRYPDRPELIDGTKLKALIAQGASIAINAIQTLSPSLDLLAQVCELAFGESVNINAYLTSGLGGAFRMHFDFHDVLVMHLHGEKTWRIFDEPESYPIDGITPKKIPSDRNVVFEEVLRPGDVLYVPRGVYHLADLKSEQSFHLTIGINPARGVDFVTWLKTKLNDDPAFRQDIPSRDDPAGLEVHERLLKSRIAAALETVSLPDFLETRDAQRKPLTRISLGPRCEARDEDEVRVLLRRRAAYRPSATKACAPLQPPAEQILTMMLDQVVMSYGDLRNAFSGDAAAFGGAVDQLLASDLISITSSQVYLNS